MNLTAAPMSRRPDERAVRTLRVPTALPCRARALLAVAALSALAVGGCQGLEGPQASESAHAPSPSEDPAVPEATSASSLEPPEQVGEGGHGGFYPQDIAEIILTEPTALPHGFESHVIRCPGDPECAEIGPHSGYLVGYAPTDTATAMSMVYVRAFSSLRAVTEQLGSEWSMHLAYDGEYSADTPAEGAVEQVGVGRLDPVEDGRWVGFDLYRVFRLIAADGTRSVPMSGALSVRAYCNVLISFTYEAPTDRYEELLADVRAAWTPAMEMLDAHTDGTCGTHEVPGPAET